MNLEGERGIHSTSEGGGGGMSSVSCGNGKLRQWLIEQIDSGKYPGLVWENDEKSIFRIPWKHAGKQDYNREEDAALFKVRGSPQFRRAPDFAIQWLGSQPEAKGLFAFPCASLAPVSHQKQSVHLLGNGPCF